jgi:hypothetical protein
VRDIEKAYLYQLIEKVELQINKKIRVGIYREEEFVVGLMRDAGVVLKDNIAQNCV